MSLTSEVFFWTPISLTSECFVHDSDFPPLGLSFPPAESQKRVDLGGFTTQIPSDPHGAPRTAPSN